VDNQLSGVIDVGRRDKNSLGDQDLWTLSSLANQAATVIENARLYREVRGYSAKLERAVVARTQRLQAIKKISQVVSQGLDVEELLTVVGRGLGQIFAGDNAAGVEIAIGLAAGQYLKLTTIYSSEVGPAPTQVSIPSLAGGPILPRESVTLKPDPQEPLGYVLSRAKPVILHNANRQAAATPVHQKTLMIAPLITAGKTIGVIRVKRDSGSAFDEGDLETLESLAFQVASAIEHARLLQKSKDIAIAEERTRLASDMHDGVAQNLAYLMLQVDRCLGLVDEGSRLEAQLEKISNLLAQNIDELRRNIFDLRSVELEGKTIFTVLESFVSEFGQRWGVKTECVIEVELAHKLAQLELSPEVESSLYRILQETLANVRQHAHSTQLLVNLGLEASQWITLKIKDNGCGFDVRQIDPTNQAKNRGLGLVSMRERAERLGGALRVESVPGQGTSVLAKLPLRIN
jgi:signal transduction histidine kinase